MAAAVTSILVPGCAKGGSVAVTITAAVLVTRMAVPDTATPILSSILARLWVLKMVVCLSPVLLSPTTTP
jgi:hypothetical protein